MKRNVKEYNGLRELTPGFPQHTYFLNKEGKLTAYRKANGGVLTTFSKPLSFSRSRRKFEKIFDDSVMFFSPGKKEGECLL